ncbi:MAG: hypothetical protein KGI26_04045 [Thaumarchaeota archaeon]|nr:hypothetical protein [Nitrososphaerota archaeon]
MRRSRVVLVLNVLILIAAISALAMLALIALGGVSTATTFTAGSPISTTANGVTTISLPVTVTNRGYFALSGIDVKMNVADAAGNRLINGTLGPLTINPGQTSSFNATLVLDTSKLSPTALHDLATTSQNLTVSATLDANEPPFIAVSGSVSAQLKWGAPVSGLTEGTPTFSQYNSTTIQVVVPVSFNNDNAYYTVSGNGKIAVMNSSGTQVGSGSVTLNVPPNTSFSQNVDLFVTLPQSQLQSLITTDQTLSYTAVFSLPSGGSAFSISQPITYHWGAPLSGLTVGAPQVSPYNSTAFQVSVPVSFTDNSATIAVSTNLNAELFNSTSGALVGTGTLAVQAAPGASFSNAMIVYVKVPTSGLQTLLFNDVTLNYRAQVTGASSGVSFTLTKSVAVSWGAPVKSLAVGTVTVAPDNATYSAISAPITFTDGSSFLTVSGTASGYITDSLGNNVGTISQLTIGPVTPGTAFPGTLSGFVANSAAGNTSFVLHLTIQTAWGTVTTEVTVSA